MDWTGLERIPNEAALPLASLHTSSCATRATKLRRRCRVLRRSESRYNFAACEHHRDSVPRQRIKVVTSQIVEPAKSRCKASDTKISRKFDARKCTLLLLLPLSLPISSLSLLYLYLCLLYLCLYLYCDTLRKRTLGPPALLIREEEQMCLTLLKSVYKNSKTKT